MSSVFVRGSEPPTSGSFESSEFEAQLMRWGLAARGFGGPKSLSKSNGEPVAEFTDDLLLVDRAVSAIAVDSDIGKRYKRFLIEQYIEGRSLSEIAARFRIELWECSYLASNARYAAYAAWLRLNNDKP